MKFPIINEDGNFYSNSLDIQLAAITQQLVKITESISTQKVVTGKEQSIKKITETLVNHFNTKVVWGKHQLTKIVPILINQIVTEDENESKHKRT